MIVRVEWHHRDVANRAEIAAVVQMFVFETKEVPYKTPAKRTWKGFILCDLPDEKGIKKR